MSDRWPLADDQTDHHPKEPLQLVDPIEDVVDERGGVYGPPELNHATTASFWGIYLDRIAESGGTLTARDVCWMNVLQKCSRDLYTNHPDALTDAQGYLRNAERIAERKETQ